MLSFLIGACLLTALAAGTLILVCVAFLSVVTVVEELKKYKKEKQESLNRVGFSLKEKLDSGHYQVVTGIWDEQDQEIKAGTVFDAENVDNNIKMQDELVLYR